LTRVFSPVDEIGTLSNLDITRSDGICRYLGAKQVF